MGTGTLYTAFSGILKKMLWNPYLKAVRSGLTLTLPLVMAGCAAMLIANFPLPHYQDFMFSRLGQDWQVFTENVAHGTMDILSIIILLTISFSLAEHQNTLLGGRDMHPAVASLVSLGCLVALIQPYPLLGSGAPLGDGIPVFWLGVHGLFLAIFVALVSTVIFFRLKRVRWLSISFFSEEADASISYAFAAMFPGIITIVLFALLKTFLGSLGVDNIHQTIYDALSHPFERMGNTLSTALLYTFLRHFFWFFGIHGANLLEPITTSIYVTAMDANIAAAAAGEAPPFIFTKTFFDSFLSMGGSGATLCLLLAVFFSHRRGSMLKISQISLLPAVFNINEMIVFGLPIVLNPVFLIPFMLVPLVHCLTTYLAMQAGLVPLTVTMIDWTVPPIISGYVATGHSYAGAFLQLANLLLGAFIYVPFVRLADNMKKEAFNQAFKELMPGYTDSSGEADRPLTVDAKSLSRSLANDLAGAVRRGELCMEYQPQVDSITGKVFGVEGLMRWNHPTLGRIPPGLFISLAEESGLIKKIGSWALEEVCRQYDAWRKEGIKDVIMSVNLSVYQLDDEDIVYEIRDRIRHYGIPKGMLEVEVTESAALGGTGRSAILHKIHSLGAALAIDDFGMGHSSLVYLKQFPVDTLKIDRVLSKDVVTSRHSAEIVSTIAELCRSLRIEVLVEFVDNEEQLKILQGLGCTRIQGWLYSPALPPDACLEFIRSGAPIY